MRRCCSRSTPSLGRARVWGLAVFLCLTLVRPGVGARKSWAVDHWAPIRVNDTRLWVSVFGARADAPILLFVHGGPGATETAFVRHFQASLGRQCLVATYDQRGAGKSYSRAVFEDSLTIDHYVDDLVAVARWLTERYSRSDVVLIGHSWGSVIGPLATLRSPELFSAYVGTGQVADMTRNEDSSYAFTVRRAQEVGNGRALRELERIGPPSNGMYCRRTPRDTRAAIGDLARQRDWLRHFGGIYHRRGFRNELTRIFRRSPLYSFWDRARYRRGVRASIAALWPRIATIDMVKSVPRLTVPVWFCLGRDDYNTPSSLAEAYFAALTAPFKELVWFEQSGHSPAFEQPAQFQALILERVLPRAVGQTPVR